MPNIKFLKTAALLAAVATAMPGALLAQNGAAPSAADQAKVQALAQDYQDVAGKLEQIRETTYEANPELAEQRDDFQAMIEERMSENGFDADAKLDRMQAIADQLKQEETGEAKKQELVKEFQEVRQSMLNAQREALSEPEVQAAGEKLQSDTLAAMKTQNEQTQVLLDRLARLREDLRKASQAG